MAGAQEKWYFTKEQLQNSPSRKCGLDADKELAYRQQAANLIQDMGQRLQVSQLCINTAIVYMHRFYAFHSFTQFHRNAIAAAALFLAAKVEEQPRKLEYVIKVAHVCIHRGEGANPIPPELYQEQAQDLVFNENVLLQTLGFDVAIDHPHTHVVRTCHLVKAPKDLAQTSYFMASNSLHLTTMCLQYRPTVVACFCIHLASKWSNWAIPQSNEGRHWFSYVDRAVTSDLLEKLTAEFLHIFDKCPSRLKRKMMSMTSTSGSSPHSSAAHPTGTQTDKKHAPTDEFDKSSFDKEYERERRRQPVPGGYVPATAPTAPQPQKIDYNLYREKREREERERREERDRRQALQAARPEQRPDRPLERPDRPIERPDRPIERPDRPIERPDRPLERPERTLERPDRQIERPERQIERPERQIERPDRQIERPDRQMERPDRQLERPTERPDRPLERPVDRNQPNRPVQQRPPQNKPHQWPHHTKPPHAKPQEHRHHRIPQHSSHQSQSQPPEPPRTRPPSLFSPENATTPIAAATRRPQQIPHPRPKPEIRPNPAPPPQLPPNPPQIPQNHRQERPPSPKRRPDPSIAIREMQPPTVLSPFSSPPSKEKQPRHRHQSNSSEPELVPVVKKLDETPGYENVIRDSQRGNAIRTKGPEQQRKIEPPRAMNGIETDPTLVSNLLKESLAKPAPITVQTERKSPVEVKREIVEPAPIQHIQPIQPAPTITVQPPQETVSQPPPNESEHKPKKEKKKKDKHKHKDKDKNREERKKHKKDKDREKKRDLLVQQEQPNDGTLRITIPRDKLSSSPGLKIKIPKERLTAPPPPPNAGLKIKIPKEVLETSRKRANNVEAGPPPKMHRQNGAPKVGNWNIPPPFRPPLPFFMVQPPPPLYYNMGMDGYYYGGMDYMYQQMPPMPQVPTQVPSQVRPSNVQQPPLPAMPPPPVPPPPPE